MSRLSSWLCAALLLGSSALYAAQDRFQLEYAKDFPYHGGRVTVDHSFGRVAIESGPGSVVHVRATIRASDPEYGKQIRVIAEERGGGVSIRTEYPGRSFRSNRASYSVDYQITVPEGAAVDVSNKYGAIEARGVTGGSAFVNAYGSIRVHDLGGNQRIENSFGPIELRNLAGAANVTNKYGPIRAQEVTGDLAVNNGFGPVEITNVRGNVNVATQNGRVELSDISGTATVSTSFGSVELRGIGGDTKVRTSFGSVFGSGLGGAIDVKNQNGAIRVSEVGAKCRPISLVTSFSSIRLTLPANASYTINARTSNGRISTALPITTKTLREDTLIGTIGNGGCPLELVNSNGAITIEKE